MASGNILVVVNLINLAKWGLDASFFAPRVSLTVLYTRFIIISAKKGKKNKGKTLALSDFLSETPGTVPTMPIRKSAMNWADEVEDNHGTCDLT